MRTETQRGVRNGEINISRSARGDRETEREREDAGRSPDLRPKIKPSIQRIPSASDEVLVDDFIGRAVASPVLLSNDTIVDSTLDDGQMRVVASKARRRMEA